MLKKILYISLIVFTCQTLFAQGVGNGGGANINVSQGGHLVTTGSGKLINNGASVINNEGTITIADEFVNNGTATIDNNGTINVAGDWTDNAGNGVFINNDKTGVAVLNGTANQTVSGSTTFENLTINNATGATFSADQTVGNTTTFTDGVITTGANNLISTSTVGSVITGNSNTSFVNGNLQKYVGYSNCLDFDGVDDWVDLGNSLTSLTNFTMEGWINYNGSGNQWFWSFSDGTYNERIQVEVNLGQIYFGWATGGGWTSFPGGAISVNTWYHIAVTNSTISGKQIFVNGTLVSSNANTLSPNALSGGGAKKCTIGRLYNTTNVHYFGGLMDEVRIWNVVRTQTEIQHAMNGLLAGTETGLVAYYQFEDGAGSGTLTDVTANTNDGSLTNMDNDATDWVSNTKHNTFVLPVGNGTATTNYYLASVEPTALDAGGFSYLDVSFGAITPGGTFSLSEEGTEYQDVTSEGEWTISGNAVPTSIKYNAKLYTENISGLVDNAFAIVKRGDGSADAADWSCTPCGFSVAPADGITANGGTGRMVADGYAERRGYTSFSKHGIAKTKKSWPLPIELVLFSAECDGDNTIVRWQTASEINNDYFTIEQSIDGFYYEAVSTLNGAGNSSSLLEYKVETNANSYNTYYRLTQVDYNGTTTSSNAVQLTPCSGNTNKLEVIKQSNSTLAILNAQNLKVSDVTLYSVSGQKIAIKVSKSENTININTSNLSVGIYLLSMPTVEGVSTVKVYIQ